MSRPADAAGELRHVLPETVAARLDWDALSLESGSFVSPQLQSRYSDLLFRTRLDTRDTYIYLLVEHQSRPDRFMPLRMTEYLVAIWNRYLRENPDTTTLPAILPIVIHSGPHNRHWNTPTELNDLIDLDPDTRTTLNDHLPHLRLILDDLTTVDLPTLRAPPLTPATRVMLALHNITAGNPNLRTDLIPLVPDIQALADAPGGTDDLRCVMTYILFVGETSEDDLGPVIDQLGPRAKEAIVTTAERIRAEGQAEGQAGALMDLLSIKFGPLPLEVRDRIAAADGTNLQIWLRRVLTAATLDEVFDQA